MNRFVKVNLSRSNVRPRHFSMASRRLVQRVSQAHSALFLCDIQEKFRKTIKYFPQIVNVSKRLLDTAKILDVPILATEQYPKGLGQLVEELDIDRNSIPIYDKMCFTMILPEVTEQLKKWKTENVILCGIEAHACVYHTTFDLLDAGYSVTVVADAVSSRNQTERMFALRQMEQAGAQLSTSECVILSLLRGADHPNFREVQRLIMQEAPDSALLPAMSKI